MLELALVRWALEKLRRSRLRAGDPAGARARARALRDRHAARHRAADLPACPTTTCTSSGTSEVALASLHDGEIIDAGRLPLRYAGFSPCFRREAGAAGTRHPRHVPRAPVRQGRDVQLRGARRLAGRARADPGDRGGDPVRASDPLPGGQHRRRRSGQLGRDQVRLRGVAARPGALPRADLLLEHHRLPGAQPGHPDAPRARAPRRCTP